MTMSADDSKTRDGQHVALVHDRLRTAILRGEIPAGTITSQPKLARELDAGRTPLREALRLLQHEGLVVSEPHRRVRIAELSSEDAEELWIMRISLEAVAIRLTVPRLSRRDLAELDGLMAQMDHYMRADDRPGLREPHRAFHQLLVAAAGPRVTDTLGQLFDHGERYRLRYGAADRNTWEQRKVEHTAIVEAVEAGDAELAAVRLTEHYTRTVALIFSQLDPEHDPTRLREAVEIVAPGAEMALQIG
jgi:DNA-binding GntR family transcriptional regulator